MPAAGVWSEVWNWGIGWQSQRARTPVSLALIQWDGPQPVEQKFLDARAAFSSLLRSLWMCRLVGRAVWSGFKNKARTAALGRACQMPGTTFHTSSSASFRRRPLLIPFHR